MLAISEIAPILFVFGVTPISSDFEVTPIPGPIVILSKIVSGSVPVSVVIQGFVPDVVVVHIVQLVRGRRGVCDSGIVAMPLSRGRLRVVKGVSSYSRECRRCRRVRSSLRECREYWVKGVLWSGEGYRRG